MTIPYIQYIVYISGIWLIILYIFGIWLIIVFHLVEHRHRVALYVHICCILYPMGKTRVHPGEECRHISYYVNYIKSSVYIYTIYINFDTIVCVCVCVSFGRVRWVHWLGHSRFLSAVKIMATLHNIPASLELFFSPSLCLASPTSLCLFPRLEIVFINYLKSIDLKMSHTELSANRFRFDFCLSPAAAVKIVNVTWEWLIRLWL